MSVAVEEAGSNLAVEAAPIRDTPIETLGGMASFGFGLVQPARVLGRLMPFESLDETSSLRGRKCLIE